jgi:hypothetical protein
MRGMCSIHLQGRRDELRQNWVIKKWCAVAILHTELDINTYTINSYLV